MSVMPQKSLADLITQNKKIFFDELTNVINPSFKGLQDPKKYDKHINSFLGCLQRPLFARQARLVAAGTEYLMKNKSLIISAEMGTGKTAQALAVALHDKFKVNFIMAPPHLVSKWADEIRTVYRDSQVNYRIVIVSRWEDLVPFTGRDLRKEGCKYFFLLSRESAKLSYRRKKAYNVKYKYIEVEEILDGNVLNVRKKIATANCPKCGNMICESETEHPHFSDIPYKCKSVEVDEDGNDIPGTQCGEVLRDVDRDCSEKMRTRISIAEYIKNQWPKGSIDLLTLDEIHEYKGGDTGQGNAMAMMCTRAKKIVGLTGTLLNGYASSLFYILYRLNPHLMKKELGLDYNQVKHFVELYGAHEEVVEAKEVNPEGIVTRMGKRIRLKEKPKISPYLLSLILDMTIFLRLDEIKMDNDLKLPSYEESIEFVDPNKEFLKSYDMYIGEIASKIKKDKRFLGNLANDSLSVADLPYNYHSAHEEVFFTPPVIRSESNRVNDKQVVLPLTNKEMRLIEIVKSELKQGRKCLVYIHFSNKGVGDDVFRILQETLSGNSVLLLKPSIDAKKRQAWIEKNPSDVLICNPELVKTGLDLLQFPTIIFYETGYNVFTLKQASRRSWRIGQRNDVKVIFMANRFTAQHKALELVGAKVNAANSLEGRLSGDDDLSSMGDDDDNIQLALAKAILNNEKMSEDIEMNKIDGIGERDWDDFEKYYLKRLEDFVVPEAKVVVEPEVVITDDKDNFFASVSKDGLQGLDLFGFGDDDTNDSQDEKITIYKRVKKGSRIVEQRMEVTKEDIDVMIGVENTSPSIQLSLF